MPLTIERLRRAIVALAALLVLAIAASLLYGRWRLRRIAQDLPGRLGLQIQQSTQGFVLSQSNGQGRTLFTLHAARAVKFKSGGRVSLHDVEIDLYNAQDNQPDTIAGTDFEFDPHSQIVQSPGEAKIVLHAPPAKAQDTAASQNADQAIRITTHGLIFNQKTGVATCDGEVDFQTAQSSGHALGAEYDSKQGQLLLKSQLVLTATLQQGPAMLHAARATYNRNDGQVHLLQPQYSSRTAKGITSGRAQTALVLLRNAGSPQQLDARGDVRLDSAGAMSVRAAAMHVLLAENSRPTQAHFSGGMRFSQIQSTQQSSGRAEKADVAFDGQGRANRVVLDRDVQLQQVIASGDQHLRRTLASDHVTIRLQPAPTGQAQIQSAEAMGNAVVHSQMIAPGRAPQQSTLAAQTLNARFAAGNQMQQIDGDGHTMLQTVAPNGDLDSSTGDTLHVEFASSPLNSPAPSRVAGLKKSASNASNGNPSSLAQSIRTAVQTGHVTLKQIAKKKSGSVNGTQTSTATAQRASYRAADDTLTLTGEPAFQNAQMVMTADRMQMERTSQKMMAMGAVQMTLRATGQRTGGPATQPSGGLLNASQPVHIIAQQATLTHHNQTAVFSGRARLWQGDNTLEAPVIEFSRTAQTLIAYSDQPCAQCVLGSFVGDAAAQTGNAAQTKGTGPQTFRILSERLIYSDTERKASFLNHVQLTSSDGQLFANRVEVFLTPPGSRFPGSRLADSRTAKKEENLSFDRDYGGQSSVERIVATGNVRLLQPGRRATGTRLVYTSSNGHFVLTGDHSGPPTVTDVERGTVTGQSLTFASADQAIMVDGATTTRTRVQKK